MPPAWHERAQCHGDLEFIERVAALPPRNRRAAARAACAGCPVVRECAAEGLDTKAKEVVRGGLWIRTNQRSVTVKADRAELELIAAGGPGE